LAAPRLLLASPLVHHILLIQELLKEVGRKDWRRDARSRKVLVEEVDMVADRMKHHVAQTVNYCRCIGYQTNLVDMQAAVADFHSSLRFHLRMKHKVLTACMDFVLDMVAILVVVDTPNILILMVVLANSLDPAEVTLK
jgi:hypothetical protein